MNYKRTVLYLDHNVVKTLSDLVDPCHLKSGRSLFLENCLLPFFSCLATRYIDSYDFFSVSVDFLSLFVAFEACSRTLLSVVHCFFFSSTQVFRFL